ncbi:hypothetical protein RMSM_06980 [Rhodopirellula maiorica SM1]|uniref:Uncharacterized protein n=1 Tax=Rhodopirellula maiorica SM1 TaxID=1265738 RepID=M5RAK8_9BACT|nr:hypothetical protein RMSM_06980 [Rhodopirellula maiorica SM1]
MDGSQEDVTDIQFRMASDSMLYRNAESLGDFRYRLFPQRTAISIR